VATSKATAVNEEAFARLLEQLDADRDRAGVKYEELRRVLIRFFEWRGAPYPEEHADDTFDRVARKLAGGVAIANVGAYCYEVARLISLEALKTPALRRAPIEGEAANAAVMPAADADDSDADRRMQCLHRCLGELPVESRRLILDYYGEAASRPVDHRRTLAARLGVDRDALANRVQRVRNKLEACVSRCLAAAGDMNRSVATLIKRPDSGRNSR
jgi:DNA-directed RNA polymerase specialized sigma24 family protein